MITPKRHTLWLLSALLNWGFVFATTHASAVDVGDSTDSGVTTSATVAADSMANVLGATNHSASAPAPKSKNVTINLINRLVQRGILSAEDAQELIQQAEKDAAEAQVQTSPPTPETQQATNDTISVPYVPEIVKAQIRDEVEAEVMKRARDENWAGSNAIPSWVSSFLVKGDIRVRFEDDFFPKGNDNTGAFPDFNAINTGAPFDTSPGPTSSPQRNVDQFRDRMRLRARIGAEIDLKDGFTAGLRLATGQDDSPVSANQSLGAANNGQGGGFSKYAIWLDRAYIKYEVGGLPNKNLAVSVGRFDNPFYSTSIIWAENIGFDGVALQGRREVVDGVTPFGTAGVFPIFNTDLNFSSDRPDKFPSEDKWLDAAQLGIDWNINEDFSVKAAGAYYYFQNVAGKLSNPFVPLTAQDHGNTDDLRPSFAQYGNTYMPLRIITPDAANNFGAIDQWQYFGLATPFQDVDFIATVDYKHFDPFHVSLTGEFIKNVAFDQSHIESVAVNNRGPDQPSGAAGPYVGGDTAWIVILKLGNVTLEKRWDWNLRLDYRYVESDSVIDGFCDNDFGGGGTNVKGYSIGAALALAPRIAVGVRWFSSDQVAGPTLKADTFQVDLNAKF